MSDNHEETDLEKVVRLAMSGTSPVNVRSYNRSSSTGKSIRVRPATRGAPSKNPSLNPGGAIRQSLGAARQANYANKSLASSMGSANPVTVGSSTLGRTPMPASTGVASVGHPAVSNGAVQAEARAASAGAAALARSAAAQKAIQTAQIKAQTTQATAQAKAQAATAKSAAKVAKAQATSKAAAAKLAKAQAAKKPKVAKTAGAKSSTSKGRGLRNLATGAMLGRAVTPRGGMGRGGGMRSHPALRHLGQLIGRHHGQGVLQQHNQHASAKVPSFKAGTFKAGYLPKPTSAQRTIAAHKGLEAAARYRSEHIGGVHHTPDAFHDLIKAHEAKSAVKSVGRKVGLSNSSEKPDEHIAMLQHALNEHGLPCHVDGIMGLETFTAIKAYLKSVGIVLEELA